MAQVEGTAWTGEELAASVAAYRKMQELEARGERYVKKRFYEQLEDRFGRDAKAFERRLQNISAVLNDAGQPWLKGLAPASNVGATVTTKLRRLLSPGGLPAYHAMLPAMRQYLIEVARQGEKTTYGTLMALFGLDRFTLMVAMSRLGHWSRRRGEPILTAVIVNAETGHCSPGISTEFGVTDDEAERSELYAYWRSHEAVLLADPEPAEGGSLEQRAARFARQEVRPKQAAFRKAVFLAYGGRCAISGCPIRSALDAAHRKGRDWRKGHNLASDGILLRKDLHALYDAGLLEIDSSGKVVLDAEAKKHYQEHEGKRVPGLRASK